MPAAKLDFAAIAAAALARAEQLIPQWLPGGKRIGHEWRCADLSGAAGESLSVNLTSGLWADFANDDRGGDLISLYAAIHGIKQGEAARRLAAELGFAPAPTETKARKRATKPRSRETKAPAGEPAAAAAEPADAWHDAGAWPVDGPPAPVAHSYRGKPQASWAYRDVDGNLLGWVHRFATSSGGKEILPCVWSRHPAKGLAWRWRAFDAPRPLYALDRLQASPALPVLVVEGEKCVELAQRVLGAGCIVTTWPGGAKAADRANWAWLAQRRVVIWPDADAKRAKNSPELLPEPQQPGMRAAETIAALLAPHAAQVRIVAIPAPGEKPDGWDVADCIAEAGGPDAPGARAAVLAWLAPERLRLPRSEGLPTPAVAAQAAASVAPAPPELEPGDWRRALRWERGQLVKHSSNICEILRNDERWRGVIAYDEFAQRVVKRTAPPYAFGREGEWTADDDVRTAVWLSQQHRLDVSSKQVVEAIESVARERTYHPVVEHLRTLRWDGERRLGAWLSKYLGVTDSEYAQCVGTYFLRGMVWRVLRPGCKFDYCLVIEGAEGLRKSTLAETLGVQWGSDTPLDLDNNREAALALHGNWVVEFSEMESVTRAEAHLQKSFLSRRFDQYRPFWSGRNTKVQRQCVFIGTTNETEYIKEGQGARRFWPIAVAKKIDIEGLRRELPQLLAEAVADFDAGEHCYPTDDEQENLFRPEQSRRVVQESLIDALHDWVLDPDLDESSHRLSHDGCFSLAEAAFRCLKVSYAQLTRDLQTRIGKALAALGCERLEKRNGMTRYWYKPPQKVARSAMSHRIAVPAQLDGDGDAPPF